MLWKKILLKKIFIFTLEMEYFPFHSEATPLFLAHKNMRKFTHTLRTVPHHPMQKYQVVMWPYFARENHLLSDLIIQFVHPVHYFGAEFSCASTPY